MKQLFQDPKAGTIQVVDVPEPAASRGMVVVRNRCSVISPGTERNAVAAARNSYLKTARARPDLVRRVLDSVKREGLLATYRKVQSKLGEPQALGYSSAGVVQAVGAEADDLFRVGDRVACAGAGYASHAEVIAVPSNLVAKIPEGVPFESAAFATMGAIAMHGVRQAEPRLGERIAVIGCGILGLITVQILRAAGARVAAFDLSPELVALAREHGAHAGIAGDTDDQVQTALAWTGGVGVDAAVVTAASSSDAPMVAAAGMCRDRGRVVAVGLVPYGIPREIAFTKEIELRIARSYGPGRYDPRFEEQGVDYPIGYVRWTETRNLESFLELLGDGSVRMEPLITHRYDLDDAIGGYDALMESTGRRPLGMVLSYPERPAESEGAIEAPTPKRGTDDRVGTAFIGAGAFAKSVLLPRFRAESDARLVRVATARGLSAHDAQRKFGFEAIGTDAEAVFADPAVDLVCIATRHDLHGELVVRALDAGKHVFVEKPLALTDDELEAIERAERNSPGLVLVGFNRRFAPMAVAVREALASRGPKLMTCRVNAGPLPTSHWLNDPRVGGGRMIGEGCHFVDLLSALAGDPELVDVHTMPSPVGRGTTQDFGVQLRFADGSVGQLLYAACGDPSLGKERIEVHAGGASAVIEDWQACTIRRGGRVTKVRGSGKGHAEEVRALLDAVRSGGPSPIPIEVAARVTRATFAAHAVLRGSETPPEAGAGT